MNRLKERRVALGMTQAEVAALLTDIDPRCDGGMVSRFECGACLPTADVLTSLASILQTTESALFDSVDLAVIRNANEADGEKNGITEDAPDVRLIVSLIPVGKVNAIPRTRLARLLGTNDRSARALVQKARECGHIIINAQDGRGYYRTEDLDEIERQYKQDTARAMSILSRRKTLRRTLIAAGREVK